MLKQVSIKLLTVTLILILLSSCGCKNQAAENVELPNIDTEEHIWNGYKCLTFSGYSVIANSANGFLSSPPSKDQDAGVQLLSYREVPEQIVSGWDKDPFSEEHICILFGVTDTAVFPEKVIGHSERQVSNSVNCYHLFQEQEIDLDGQKYDGIFYCFAKVYSNDTNALIIAATCLEDNGVLIFDKLVDTLAALGDSIYVGS